MCHVTSSFSAALGSPRGTKIDLTNSITLEFNGRTILQHLCKDKNYFEFNIKLETNMQNGYNVRDQIAYSLLIYMRKLERKTQAFCVSIYG